MTTPFGRKVRAEEEREKNDGNSGHYILPEMPKGKARTSRPIVRVYIGHLLHALSGGYLMD